MNDEPTYTKEQAVKIGLCGSASDINDLGEDPDIVAKIVLCEEDMELVRTINSATEKLYGKYFDIEFEADELGDV